MSPTFRALSPTRTTSHADCLPVPRWREQERRLLYIALTLWLVFGGSLFAGAEPLTHPGKKLIEYGWDVPTPKARSSWGTSPAI